MPDFSFFWVEFWGVERERWHIPNSKQYNQYWKCHLNSFQKVCHYRKKNLYRANTLTKICKVLTSLAMSPPKRLFLSVSISTISFSHEDGLFLNVVSRKMMSFWFLCPLFTLFFVNHLIHVTHPKLPSFVPLIFIVCIHTPPPAHPWTHRYSLDT